MLLLLVCAIVYPMVAPSTATSASSPSTQASGDPSGVSDASPVPSTATPGAGDTSESPSAVEKSIQMYGERVTSAKPFETVRIRGSYRGGPETFLRVERREGARWVAFPIQPKTDHAGRFIAYVEMGQPGPCWLRVRDPVTGVASEEFVVVIEG